MSVSLDDRALGEKNTGISPRVYFAQASSGNIKIGTSARVATRLTELASQYKQQFTLLAEIPGDELAEKQVHDFLESDALGNELFRDSPRVFELIAFILGMLPLEHSSFSEKERMWCRELVLIGLRPPRTHMRMRLIAARKSLGLSQEALAKKAKIAQPSLSKIELGDSMPRGGTAVRLCGVLNLTLEDLLRVELINPTEVV